MVEFFTFKLLGVMHKLLQTGSCTLILAAPKGKMSIPIAIVKVVIMKKFCWLRVALLEKMAKS